LAEENDSTAIEPDETATSLTRSRRAARAAATRPKAGRPARAERVAATPAKAPRPKRKPMRSLAVYGVIGALVATVAIPAYAATRSGAEARTIQQVAADDAQSLVVASDATASTITRDSYSATTPDEVAKKKAEEAAAARARQSSVVSAASLNIDLNMHANGTGAIRWPLNHVDHVGEGFGARGGEHQGVDLLDPARTPIFAAMAGTVKVSQESFGGYGVCVSIDSVVDGKVVSTLYGHMTYGSRVVQSGQKVEAGQLIGLVGSTGRSTANHLHFEVMINGTHVDPLAWLLTNVGPVP
jgi:murein DD-endopeptidase MepM/ murein hydrolase activator NlpD